MLAIIKPFPLTVCEHCSWYAPWPSYNLQWSANGNHRTFWQNTVWALHVVHFTFYHIYCNNFSLMINVPPSQICSYKGLPCLPSPFLWQLLTHKKCSKCYKRWNFIVWRCRKFNWNIISQQIEPMWNQMKNYQTFNF